MNRKHFIISGLFILMMSLVTWGYGEHYLDGEYEDTINSKYWDCYEFGTFLPDNGSFINGTAGWTIISSGQGTVTSTTSHWITLSCHPGDTAGIEYGPITIGTTQLDMNWDQLGGTLMHHGGDSTNGYQYCGKLSLELFDGAGSPYVPMQMFDTGNVILYGYGANIDTTGTFQSGVSTPWQFVVPHQMWNKMSKCRVLYTIPITAPAGTYKVSINQIYLATIRVRTSLK